MPELFTIGHSNHDILDFMKMLHRHDIRVLVDIRSDPYSRYASQFNKSDFQRHVEAAEIDYRYSGNRIGGKPTDQSLYTASGKPDYDKLAATEQFQSELDAILEIAERKKLVLMCSEADPMGCHRGRIIAQVLRSRGVTVTHIMPDGSAAPTEQKELF